MTRKTPKANRIPDAVQRPIRSKLRLLREANNIKKMNVNVISSHSVHNYEDIDLSTLRLGDLHALSERYGIEFPTMISQIFLEDKRIDENSLSSMRINSLISCIDNSEDVQMIIDFLERLAKRSLDRAT